MGFRHTTSAENFPDGVLSNIFIRLCAKQLAQMRCVSKYWNEILWRPSFIKSHLDHSIKNNKDGVLLTFSYENFSFASKPFTAHPARSPHLELTNFIKLPVNLESNNNHGEVIGSINGLICFKYGSNHGSQVIYIWNPSLSALLTLPPYYGPSGFDDKEFGFGYDPKTDDYKVVKLAQRTEKLPMSDADRELLRDKFARCIPKRKFGYESKEWLLVEVYSMRKGTWKFITQRIQSHVVLMDVLSNVCVNDHLHWLSEANIPFNWSETILTFDLGAETFSEIPLPDSLKITEGDEYDYVATYFLGVLDGKLCVMSKTPGLKWEVWVMDEYGVAESWMKHYVFLPLIDDLQPLGFTLHNEFIYLVEERELVLYDQVDAKNKIFKSSGDRFFQVVDYVDSLVWLTPVEQRKMNCYSISQFQF